MIFKLHLDPPLVMSPESLKLFSNLLRPPPCLKFRLFNLILVKILSYPLVLRPKRLIKIWFSHKFIEIHLTGKPPLPPERPELQIFFSYKRIQSGVTPAPPFSVKVLNFRKICIWKAPLTPCSLLLSMKEKSYIN